MECKETIYSPQTGRYDLKYIHVYNYNAIGRGKETFI